ncbi:MAG TPA: NADPH:quinone oxidoreductase family protein [Opitutaceae bacterium]|nr:NADPH:quinone oxidoreductase family protein [Opitutaceae bacterium]
MHVIQVDAYGDASVLKWCERPEPVPGRGEVAIRVQATSVNFADIMSRRGGYSAGSKPPFVPGLDCTGTIAAVGPGVTGLAIGQRVAAFPDQGSYGEVVIARDILTYPLNASVSVEAGASLVILVTAYNLLHQAARLLAGETVLIHAGAGGVGSIAIQVARAMGAGRIFATVGDASKFAIAQSAGADVVINYRTEDVGRRILAETQEKGVDVILDSVAGDTFTNSLPALAPFGRYVIYGQASGSPGTLQTPVLHRENRAVIGYSTGTTRKRRPEALRAPVEAVFGMVAQGKIKVLIGARFPLKDAAKAHELVESRHSTGKVLLDV